MKLFFFALCVLVVEFALTCRTLFGEGTGSETLALAALGAAGGITLGVLCFLDWKRGRLMKRSIVFSLLTLAIANIVYGGIAIVHAEKKQAYCKEGLMNCEHDLAEAKADLLKLLTNGEPADIRRQRDHIKRIGESQSRYDNARDRIGEGRRTRAAIVMAAAGLFVALILVAVFVRSNNLTNAETGAPPALIVDGE